MAVVLALLPIAIALAVVVYLAVPLRKRATPLSQVTVSGGEVVLDVAAPVWLAFRRRLRAPLSSVAGARVLPAGGTRQWLSIRTCGTGFPGLYLGWFWKRGVGHCYVVYRPARDAVEIDFAGNGRVKRWLVETADPEAVVAALSGSLSAAGSASSARS